MRVAAPDDEAWYADRLEVVVSDLVARHGQVPEKLGVIGPVYFFAWFIEIIPEPRTGEFEESVDSCAWTMVFHRLDDARLKGINKRSAAISCECQDRRFRQYGPAQQTGITPYHVQADACASTAADKHARD